MTDDINRIPAEETTPADDVPKLQKPVFPTPQEDYAPLPDAIGAEQKKPVFRIITCIVAGLALLAGIFLLCSNLFGLYDRTFKQLSFDYRDGETIGEVIAELPESRSIEDKTISITAARYSFDSAEQLDISASALEYSHNSTEDSLHEKIGVPNWLFSQSYNLRQIGNFCEEKSLFRWKSTDEHFVPDLAAICFATESTDRAVIQFYDHYHSEVDGKNYQCEIWLMEEIVSGQTVYHTIYRYYDGDRLAAVRVVKSNSDFMDVYDIKSYSVS